MSRDGREAATSDRSDAGALELDSARRLHVVRSGHELLLAEPNLERQRALPRLRKDLVRLESVPDLVRKAEPVEPARSEHDRIQPTLPALAQPRVDVPPQRLDRERRLEREQLRPAADRGRPDSHPGLDPARPAQRVPRVLPRQIGADRETVRVRRGHVLGRVHRDVDAPVE
jgi:hypothetical protein